MAERKKRVKGKENQRDRNLPISTAYEEGNPAWQSNSSIGSRARVYNNSATYTWKYKNVTGGLEKKDLKKEVIDGFKSAFNRDYEGPESKKRIKSKVASEGALKRNPWVKYVKECQQYYENKFKHRKSYPCIVGDPVAQLMYHAKTDDIRDPVDPKYYPYVDIEDVQNNFSTSGVIFPISFTDVIDYNPFDNNGPLRVQVQLLWENDPQRDTEFKLDKEKSKKKKDTGPTKIRRVKKETLRTTEKTEDVATVNYDYLKRASFNILFRDIIRKKYSKNPSALLISRPGLFEYPFSDENEPHRSNGIFGYDDLNTLYNAKKNRQQNYRNWLNAQILHAFCIYINNTDEYVRRPGERTIAISPSFWMDYFTPNETQIRENKRNMDRIRHKLFAHNQKWLFIPVEKQNNSHWYVIEVNVQPSIDLTRFLYDIIIYDSLYTRESNWSNHRESVNVIESYITDYFKNSTPTITAQNEHKPFRYAYEVLNKDWEDFPHQRDGSSCGIYTLLYLMYILNPNKEEFSNMDFLVNLTLDDLISIRLLFAEFITRKYVFVPGEELAVIRKENRKKKPKEDAIIMDLTVDSSSRREKRKERETGAEKRKSTREKKSTSFFKDYEQPKKKQKK